MTLPIEQMEVCSDLISCASCTLISLNLNFSFGLACPNFQKEADGTVKGTINPPILGPSFTSIIGV